MVGFLEPLWISSRTIMGKPVIGRQVEKEKEVLEKILR